MSALQSPLHPWNLMELGYRRAPGGVWVKTVADDLATKYQLWARSTKNEELSIRATVYGPTQALSAIDVELYSNDPRHLEQMIREIWNVLHSQLGSEAQPTPPEGAPSEGAPDAGADQTGAAT